MKKKLFTIYCFAVDLIIYFKKLLKYSASINVDNDIEKMQYTLLRQNHVIEKGMSMKNPKLGFGQKKVYDLLLRLEKYYTLYKSKDISFLQYPLSTINTYILFSKKNGINNIKIKDLYNDLVKKTNLKITNSGCGVEMLRKKDILRNISSNYSDFVYSRHSIRYFSKETPGKEDILEALKLAQRTPSACNRQSWFSHIFYNEEATSLLKLQGGARGFEEEIPMAILVTANMKAFFDYEKFQAYIDGGLYAMNLIHALHAQGLGTIPLSCGFPEKRLDKIYDTFLIPKNEILIMIIGVGELLDTFKVAKSQRKNIELTTIWH